MNAQTDERTELFRQIRARHPRLREALIADARIAARHRGEPDGSGSRLGAVYQIVRLAFVSDAFLALALYRCKARLQALGVPILPRIAHRLAIAIAQVSIGDPVVVEAGVYIVHGQVVIDGITEVRAGVVIGPFVTVGLRAGNFSGPAIENGVSIGAGASVIGPVRIGAGARVGAGAVVVHDVPSGATVVGVPAHPV
jgi:serine O-acetyltransferase